MIRQEAFRLGALCGLALLGLVIGGCTRSDRPQPAGAVSAEVPQPITTKLGIEMVLIRGGQFVMGDESGETSEQPAHPVEVSPFYMDTCEVTQDRFKKLMGTNPAKFPGPDRPVERVSWYSAILYCNMRSLREGFQPCYDRETLACDFGADGYRLPTEAEWEYACRAGSSTRWSFGDDPRKLVKHAWFKGNTDRKTHPVKQKSPNPWGLYDVHGNVAEWCHDFISPSYEQPGEGKDPRGPASGEERVLRGGSWAGSEPSCRSAARSSATPRFADACFGTETYGFRCVRSAVAGRATAR